MENKISIFSTKKISHSLASDFFSVDCVDFIEIKPMATNQKIVSNHFIFTSKNAVKQAFAQYDFKEIKKPSFYCVGEKTAQLLQKKGFHPVFVEQSAEELAKKIVLINQKEFTFFCGNIHLEILPNILKSNYITLQKIVLYETIQKPIKIEKLYDAYIFYSPSGVDSFFTLNTISQKSMVFAIGQTTAKRLSAKINNKIIVPSASKIDEILAAIKAHYNL